MVLLPAALFYAVWRYYVVYSGVAELKPLPFGEWHWAVLPATFAGIAGAVAAKPAYFVAEAVAIGCFPLLLRRQSWSSATRFLGFNAGRSFFLYNGFLIVTYVAHFSPLMSEEAHSYFRYNTHLVAHPHAGAGAGGARARPRPVGRPAGRGVTPARSRSFWGFWRPSPWPKGCASTSRCRSRWSGIWRRS